MSKITIALEAAVSVVLANTPVADARPTARQRADADRAFGQILKLIAPRIRHFIRQYGLVAHWEDAEQACAIGVHRAIQGYEPDKAQFTTFVNWQLRGELQSLRFRVMTDQRPSAKKVDATTVSLHAVTSRGDDSEDATLESMIPDDDALGLTEAGASEYLAGAARTALVDKYVEHLRSVGTEALKRRAKAKRAPVAWEPGVPRLRAANGGVDAAELAELERDIAQHRLVVERRVFDDMPLDDLEQAAGIPKERVRQIAKRAAKAMAELIEDEPMFAIITDGRTVPVAPPRNRRKTDREGPTMFVPAAPPEPIVAAPRPSPAPATPLRELAVNLEGQPARAHAGFEVSAIH